MTFIEFGNTTRKHKTLYALGSLVLAGLVIGNIALYNQVIGMKHNLEDIKDTIERSQVLQVELEDQVFDILDQVDADTFLQQQGYVSEKHPSYMHGSPVLSHQDL